MAKLKYFGTDGIRGTAGISPMSEDFVERLGWAAGTVLRYDAEKQPVFLIGRDTRESGSMLQRALARGLALAGAEVKDLGVMPTPGIAALTHRLEATAGAIISASHNPAAENGIKFFSATGMKLSEAQESAIEELIDSVNETPSGSIKPESALAEAENLYIKDLRLAQPGLDLTGLTLLVDCANGAAYAVAPLVFELLGARVIAINANPDGLNINDHAGSEYVRSDPSRFSELIQLYGADVGIAFDGDADRVILFDNKGRLTDGDHMLAILAEDYHNQGRLLGNALVITTMANGALALYAKQRGFQLIETPVGDKYVTDALLALSEQPDSAGKVGVGGEQSGHIVLLDEHHRTGDGLRTALDMLRVITQKPDRPFSELFDHIHKFPQMIASCYVGAKPDLNTLPELSQALTELEHRLPGLVRKNARYSGTEYKFRLMLETDTRHKPADVAALAWEICDIIQRETGAASGAKIEVLNVADGGLMPRPDPD
jgi:phosphoglucosamine mutase